MQISAESSGNKSMNSTSVDRAKCQWNSINWNKANKTVKNIQFRIFRATREGDVQTVRRLQKLLIKSYDNKLLAVRQIAQLHTGTYAANKKFKYKDMSQLMVHTPQQRGNMVDVLGEYSIASRKCFSVKHASVSKDKKKAVRREKIKNYSETLSFVDQCFECIVKNALEPEWEARFEGSSYGFRPGRSSHDALGRIYNNCAHHQASKTWVLNTSIVGCFDTILHKYLMETIDTFPGKYLIEGWLKSGYINKNIFYHDPLNLQHTNNSLIFAGRDLSQRSVISPLLVNIVLHGIQEALAIKISNCGETLGDKSFVRYANNFVVFCKSEAGAKESSKILNNWLSRRGLNVSKENSKIAHIDDGFNFLGTTIRRFYISDIKTTLLIKPSKKSILKCRSKLKNLWVKGYGNPVSAVVHNLNAFIQTWSNSFRPYASKEVFSSLDNLMFTLAVRFTRRTHPLKSWKWRKNRYFGKFYYERKDNWVFGDKESGHFIVKFSWFSIKPWTTVRGDYSPLNPDLINYWDQRNSIYSHFQFFKKSDIKIASNQNHMCPICKLSLYNGEQLVRHHKVSENNGESYIDKNIVFVHIFCQ